MLVLPLPSLLIGSAQEFLMIILCALFSREDKRWFIVFVNSNMERKYNNKIRQGGSCNDRQTRIDRIFVTLDFTTLSSSENDCTL